MKRIAIVGPECSGKTTLAKALSEHFQEPWVPEYAREFLNDIQRPYKEEDLVAIANGQLLEEAKAQKNASNFILCDTEMITLYIWNKEKFGKVHPTIEQLVNEVHYDHYFLCSPDMPWEADPLRENEHDRERLFHLYEEMLKGSDRSFTVLEGNASTRIELAVQVLNALSGLTSSE